jgi:hypothetical protein
VWSKIISCKFKIYSGSVFNYTSFFFQLLIFMANDATTVDGAFEKVKLFFKLKMNTPEVFRNRNPYSDELATTFQNANFLYLPVTPQGYSVVYASLRNYSVSAFVFDSIAKAFFMTAGEKDCEGLSFVMKKSSRRTRTCGSDSKTQSLMIANKFSFSFYLSLCLEKKKKLLFKLFTDNIEDWLRSFALLKTDQIFCLELVVFIILFFIFHRGLFL